MKPEHQALWERYRDSLPASSQRPLSTVVWNFLTWLKDRELSEKSVLKYLQFLRDDQRHLYADGTVHKVFAILTRFAKINGLAWQFKRDQRPAIRESEVRNYALPLEAVQLMVDICRGKAEARGKLLPTACHTAMLCLATVWWMRSKEMRIARAEDVDLDHRMLYVDTVKHGRQRYHTIPEHLVPYLERWDFDTPISQSQFAGLFMDLREMIGLNVYGVGWHAIRRSAVKEADKLGMTTAQKNVYGRWTVGASQQAIRYSMAKTIAFDGSVTAVGLEDQETDQLVYTRHPFVSMWK